MEKFRKGDVVAIEGVISADYEIEGKIKVAIKPYHDIFVDADVLTMRRPEFRVGDLVENDGSRGLVIAVHGEYLWIEGASFSPESWPADNSRRIEPEPAPTTHENGAPMFAADGTMLDDKGNRSIFDDVDAFDGDPVETPPSAPEVQF